MRLQGGMIVVAVMAFHLVSGITMPVKHTDAQYNLGWFLGTRAEEEVCVPSPKIIREDIFTDALSTAPITTANNVLFDEGQDAVRKEWRRSQF